MKVQSILRRDREELDVWTTPKSLTTAVLVHLCISSHKLEHTISFHFPLLVRYTPWGNNFEIDGEKHSVIFEIVPIVVSSIVFDRTLKDLCSSFTYRKGNATHGTVCYAGDIVEQVEGVESWRGGWKQAPELSLNKNSRVHLCKKN